LSGGNDEKPQETLITIACVPAEIRTENIPDTSQDCYRYINPNCCNIVIFGEVSEVFETLRKILVILLSLA
jgi:hypothetical protein